MVYRLGAIFGTVQAKRKGSTKEDTLRCRWLSCPKWSGAEDTLWIKQTEVFFELKLVFDIIGKKDQCVVDPGQPTQSEGRKKIAVCI